MVTIITLVWGISALILLVASSPSITGILTSIRTRSGPSARQVSRACRPLWASATTSMPSSPESMVLKPSLTRAWSSAIRRRAVCDRAVASLLPILFPPLTVYLDKRYLRHRFGAFSGLAVDFRVAAQQGHPLTHAREAQALAGPAPFGSLLRVEARPPVSHVETHAVVQELECDPHPGRGGVLAYVSEGLLRDPEQRRLDFRRQTLVSQRYFVIDLGALVADLLDLQAHGGAQPEIVECCGPEIRYDVPCFAYRLLDELQDPGEVCAAFVGGGWMLPGERLQELVGPRGRLRETVVYLVGYLAALLLLGRYEFADQILQPVLTLGQVRVEPRVLQGAGALVGQADQGLLILPLHEGFRSVGFEHADEPVPHQQREVQANQMISVLIPRPPQLDGLRLPTLQYLLAGGHGLGREPRLPQALQAGGSPDVQFSTLVGDADNRGGEVRDVARYLEQSRADLLSLQAGAEDLARFVEGEQGIKAALEALRGAFALGYIVDDNA